MILKYVEYLYGFRDIFNDLGKKGRNDDNNGGGGDGPSDIDDFLSGKIK
jgi:hypothetical protein